MQTVLFWSSVGLSLLFIKEIVEYLTVLYVTKYSNWRASVLLHYCLESRGNRWGYVTRLLDLKHVMFIILLMFFFRWGYPLPFVLYVSYIGLLVITYSRFSIEVEVAKVWQSLDEY